MIFRGILFSLGRRFFRCRIHLQGPTPRSLSIQILEQRQMLAATTFGYHNFGLRHDVSGDGAVSPIDALQIINILNRNSDSGTSIKLSYDAPAEEQMRHGVDVSCDGFVTPIDALIVINGLNRGVFQEGLAFENEGGQIIPVRNQETNQCSARLRESDSYLASIGYHVLIPENSKTLVARIDNLNFDLSDQDAINDAFEIALVDPDGFSLIAGFEQGRESLFNATEGMPFLASSEITFKQSNNNIEFFIPLKNIPTGQLASISFRIVNPDQDTESSFDLVGFEFLDTTPEQFPEGESDTINAVFAADSFTLLDHSVFFNNPKPTRVVNNPSFHFMESELRAEGSSNTFVQFNDFSDTTGLALNGAAHAVDVGDTTALRLAIDYSWSTGSAFSDVQVNAKDFSTAFAFRITNAGGISDCEGISGADGFTFAVQSVSESIGGAGDGLGYAGIPRSVAVEFDTYCNWQQNDPSSNHVSFNTGGLVYHPEGDVLANVDPPFDNGEVWYAWVDYNGQILELRLNQTGIRPANALIREELNIAEIIESDSAYIGFTAGTGLAWANHDILTWQYNEAFSPIGAPELLLNVRTPSGTAFANTRLLLSGSAVSTFPADNEPVRHATVTHVLVNGESVDALDSAGNFYAPIVIEPGLNRYLVEAHDEYGNVTSSEIKIQGITDDMSDTSLSTLTEAPGRFSSSYGRTSIDVRQSKLFVDTSIRYDGTTPVYTPAIVTVSGISDTSVSLANGDQGQFDEVPFIDFSERFPRNRIVRGTNSAFQTLEFDNPLGRKFMHELVAYSTANTPPQIQSAPVVDAVSGTEYSYQVQAVDPESELVNFSLKQSPEGMTVDLNSGAIHWLPTNSQIGSHAVEVEVRDQSTGTASQSFILQVKPESLNNPPIIVSTPSSTAFVSSDSHGTPIDTELPYIYQIVARDFDRDELTYSLVESPVAMTVNASTGFVSWRPTPSDLGDHQITIEVSDEFGGMATQTFIVCVLPTQTNASPTIVSVPITEVSVSQKTAYQYLVVGIDPDDDSLEYSLASGPSGMSISSSGLLTWPTHSMVPGSHQISISAADPFGNEDTQEYALVVSELTTGEIRGVVYHDVNGNGTRDIPTPVFQLPSVTISPLNEGTSFVVGTDLAPTTRIVAAVSGVVDFNADNGNNYSADWNAAGIVVNSRSGRLSVGGTDYEFLGQGWLAATIGNDDLGFFPLFGLSEENGLGSDAPPSTLYLDRPVGDIFENASIEIPAGTQLTVRIFDYPRFDNAGEFLITPSPNFSEVGINQRRVFADSNLNGLFDLGEPTALTDFSGYYRLEVPAGRHLVYTELPNGWRQTEPQPQVILSRDVSITEGSVEPEINFGQALLPLGHINQPPQFTSTPLVSAIAYESYRYDVLATSPAQQPIEYRLVKGPAGMTIHPRLGVVSWYPTQSYIGSHPVVLQAIDSNGLASVQTFQLAVEGINTPPVFTSNPITTVTAGKLYSQRIRAMDAEQDAVEISLRNGPQGMVVLLIETLNSQDQIIDAYYELTWDTQGIETGSNFDIQLVASDSQGALSDFQYSLSIVDPTSANSQPRIESRPSQRAQIGRRWAYQIEATDANGGPLSYNVDADISGITVSDSGLVEWTPDISSVGTTELVVSVTDDEGAEAHQRVFVSVSTVDGNQSPVITSTLPRSALVGELFTVRLSADDPDGDSIRWELLDAPSGMAIDARSGLLAWTPTIAQLGTHEIRIGATDPTLGRATQTFVVEVACVNTAPTITSSPVLVGVTDRTYIYPAIAIDAEDDTLVWTLQSGPAGMTIDSGTNVIRWTPRTDQLGQYPVVVRVTDGLNTSTQHFNLQIEDSNELIDPNDPTLGTRGNRPPIVTSTPSFFANVGFDYQYAVIAFDPDEDTLSYELAGEVPAGMTVNDEGILVWQPEVADEGTYQLGVLVRDRYGASTVQSFALEVAINTAPTIDSLPPESLVRGSILRYFASASDLDGDTISWSIENPDPSNIAVDDFGRIRWNSRGSSATSATFTLIATDQRGATASQPVNIPIVDDVLGPTVSLAIYAGGQTFDQDATIALGAPYVIRATAFDDAAVDTLLLTVNDTPVALDRFGTAAFVADSLGEISLQVIATDINGLETVLAGSVTIVDPADVNRPSIDDPTLPPHPGFVDGDTTDPTVYIDTPLPGDTVTAPTPIIGTVEDPDDNFWFYRVYQGRADLVSTTNIDLSDPDWELIEQRTEEVVNGEIAIFDPSKLSNDVYTVLVAAYDVNLNGFANWTTINVEGNLTLGNFAIDLTDLEIPLSGIPISISRQYDTIDRQSQLDFGYGWSLGVYDPRILETAPDNTEFIPGSTKVYLTDPDGNRIGFTYEEEPIPLFCYGPGLCIYQGYLGDQQFRPYFRPDPGVYATLESSELDIITRGGLSNSFGSIIQALGGGPTVNPRLYTLTTKEGLKYDYSQSAGLRSITDLNGNVVKFTGDKILHSDGQAVEIKRDARGRVISITDPAANTINYTYDLQGNLETVTNQEGLVTSYVYDSGGEHFLSEAFDPLGNRSLAVIYDADGIFSHVEDAYGQIINSQSFNIQARTGIVRDARGNETTLLFDDRGNVLAETDPLGGTKRYYYEDPANPDLETKIVDKNGHVTKREYDNRGNLLANIEVGPEAMPFMEPMVTRYTYDSGNRVTSVTDARNNTVSYSYDDRGNLTSISNALGYTSYFTYDSSGDVATFTDFNGKLTRFDNYESGQPTLITFGDDTQQRIAYNIYGQVTFEAFLEPNGAVAWQQTTQYDALGRKVEEVLGSTADGSATTRRFFYDGNLLDWEILVHPDSLGANGELLESPATPIDQRHSSITDYDYDAKSQLIWQTDAEGGVIAYRYDADGNRIALRDPVGNITTWYYDQIGNPIEERDPFYWNDIRSLDSAYTELSDDDWLDLIAPINPNSQQQALAFELSGAACDSNTPAPHVILTCFDSVGNLTKKIDRNARRTEYDHNYMGDLLEERWYTPENELVRTLNYTYDAVGNMLTASDPGSSLTFTYDAANQQTSADNAGTPGVPRVLLEYEFDPNGNISFVTDDSGVTVASEYNQRNLLAVRQWYDGTNAGGSEVDPLRFEFRYNAAGRGTLTRRFASLDTSILIGFAIRGFDTAGRSTLIDFIDDNGEFLAHFAFGYDALGSMSNSSRNGVDASYTHDLNGQLTSAIRSTANNEVFQYDANGNRTLNGYSYSVGNRLLSEGTHSFEYDRDGNRVLKENAGSGEVTRYEYDHRNRLVRVQNTTSDVSQERLSLYQYDALNRRIRIENSLGQMTTVYDGHSAWRDSDLEAGNVTHYLFDEQIDTLLAVHSSHSGATVIDTDITGSVVGTTTLISQTRQETQYLSFGSPESSSSILRFGFTGREFDQSTQLYYYRARYYDAAIGAFLSEDPLGFDSEDLNHYRYVSNSPLLYIDPSGKIGLYLYGESSYNSGLVAGFSSSFFDVTVSYAGELLGRLIVFDSQVDVTFEKIVDEVLKSALQQRFERFEAGRRLVARFDASLEIYIPGQRNAVDGYVRGSTAGLLFGLNIIWRGVDF